MARVRAVLSDATRSFEPGVRTRREGRVVGSSDGVLRIAGLMDAGVEELVEIGDRRATGLVMSIDPEEVRAVALHGAEHVNAGDVVSATHERVRLPVGDALLGRVVDPLGRFLDGQPSRGSLSWMPLERAAPGIAERAAVHRPLLTGLLAVDAMLPIGCGQRELILGDDRTGKTSLALDAVIRQRNAGVVSVYVAVGRRRSEVWQIVEDLRRYADRWVVVMAAEDQSPGIRYLAPYAGTTIAEHFMRRGEHALVVYDDLSSHAVAWRELSLLLRRPPGREAYPGDVFYLHSRLLERAAQLSPEQGGGSLTAIPIATLEAGRLTGYVATNLISITDGQIVLSQQLFSAGQKPAIDAGLSVSRVGAKAQPQALRDLAGRLRLDYASFLELETFARLGTRLEEATRQRLEIGRRIRELLRGARLQPLSLFDEVIRLLIGAERDLLLAIPGGTVTGFAEELATLCRAERPTIASRIERDAVLSGDDRETIVAQAWGLLDRRQPVPTEAPHVEPP
ncbi:MAG: F0F1 ATP synthase subunit alpha [Deltaproteobacteria bacterium]|nr:F0F1 ATP synthase subunit alpha [Deltaproteobacteria bacterium]